MKSEPATKDDLKNLGEGLREAISGNTREIIDHFNKSQSLQNLRLDKIDGRLEHIETDLTQVNTKLDAIMSGEILVTRKQIERLLEALRVKGIVLNVSEILAA